MLSDSEKLNKQNEAAKFVDIDICGFVSRGRLIVLQTSGDYFENLPKIEKLKVISYMLKSLTKLKQQVESE